ncbi:MAG: hypothetical protein KJO38_12460, partial [Gammaproteobacteria bacterium]|nr:hypothetical protein [Gammaproteobacteria bacterium]
RNMVTRCAGNAQHSRRETTGDEELALEVRGVLSHALAMWQGNPDDFNTAISEVVSLINHVRADEREACAWACSDALNGLWNSYTADPHYDPAYQAATSAAMHEADKAIRTCGNAR